MNGMEEGTLEWKHAHLAGVSVFGRSRFERKAPAGTPAAPVGSIMPSLIGVKNVALWDAPRLPTLSVSRRYGQAIVVGMLQFIFRKGSFRRKLVAARGDLLVFRAIRWPRGAGVR